MASIRTVLNQTLGASSTYPVAAAGDYIRVVAATGAIEVRTDRGDVFELQAGMAVHRPGSRWSTFQVTDKTGSANVVHLVVGDGATLDDNRTAISGTVSVVGTDGTAGDSLRIVEHGGNLCNSFADVTLTAGVATVVRGVATTDTARYLQADPGNAGEVLIGDAAVTAGEGIGLMPGDTIAIGGRGAMYGYSAAAGEKVRVLVYGDNT